MEYLDGPTLYDEMKKYSESDFPEESIYEIMKGLI